MGLISAREMNEGRKQLLLFLLILALLAFVAVIAVGGIIEAIGGGSVS